MSKKTPQYENFIKLVAVSNSLEEEKNVKNYWLIANILKIVTVIALILFIISIELDLVLKGKIEIAAVICLVIYIWYRTKSSKKFRNILLEDCNPDRVLALYTNLISYTKRQKDWEIHFYNLANILYYAGRSDDVKKVQSLLKKYCPTSLGNIYYEMIGAKLALYTMNREALQKHCSNMAELIKSVRLRGMMKLVYYEIMQYPALVQMWDNGEYVKLYNELIQAKFLGKTLLSKVKQNYYLYKVSSALNDKEKMDKHGTFVIQNGKELWYCKKLKEDL